jgi:hypothetical protein
MSTFWLLHLIAAKPDMGKPPSKASEGGLFNYAQENGKTNTRNQYGRCPISPESPVFILTVFD